MANQDPLVSKHIRCIFVAEESGVLDPSPCIATALGVAPPIDMSSADESHDLAVVEAHAIEDLTDMLCCLLPALDTSLIVDIHDSCIYPCFRTRKTAWSNSLFWLSILASPAERDLRTSRMLDGAIGCQNPEVGIAQVRELALDGLHELTGSVKACVFRVPGFQLVPHGGAIGTTSAVSCTIRSRRVPSQPDQDRCVAAIIPVGIVHELEELLPDRSEIVRVDLFDIKLL
mmetsp:Transcript_101327/g.254065  ORF Transcript_101327/g.254065 Transcript_101327/m.254065 type:complete len:230 (+) Transcript_101327:1370-2059(+)